MKKTFLFLISLTIFICIKAQVPQKMSYQAVVRNSSNALVTSAPIGMRVSILQGSSSGSEIYKEIYNPNPVTNANGLVSIEIGSGVPVVGSFANINWANGPFYIKIETDPSGGTNYTVNGTSQLLSVPFALYAGNVTNNGGKTILVLSDTISNVQAQAKIATEFGPNTQEIKILGCTNLTTVDLSMITKATGIYISNNIALQSVNLGNLTTCEGNFIIKNCPSLTTLNLSSLEQILAGEPVTYNLNIENTSLPNLNFTKLKKLVGVVGIRSNPSLASISFPALINQDMECFLEIGSNNELSSINFASLNKCLDLFINSNPKLSMISFPALEKVVDNFYITSNDLLTTINFPLLSSVGALSFGSNNAITSISFPALSNIINDGWSSNITGNKNLTSVSFNNLSVFKGDMFSFYQNKLPSSQVNYILNKLVSISPALTGKSFSLNQVPAAPPTGQGLVDKSTLISRGNSVTTD